MILRLNPISWLKKLRRQLDWRKPSNYASCRIQGIVRGFLARVLFKELLAEYRAAKLIQRIMLGKLGRMKWMREYWISINVVKSPEALEELVKRSVFQRETKSGYGPQWKRVF